MRKLLQYFLPLLLLLTFNACKKDDPSPELDAELELALAALSNGEGIDFFVLPQSDDYSGIPQDPNNSLTEDKVNLGQLLFHETALGINPEKPSGAKTYSCASCHFAGAGFQASRFQGIGEGGVGFGLNGEGRARNMLYAEDELDVQPLRSPAALNTAYQELMLWNGQFGATGANENTEDKWEADTPIANNHLGYEGVETQAIAGLTVHRMGLDMAFIDTTVYKSLFDNAFPEFSAEERYSVITAGLAIAAFERTVLANEAPFQKWLKGDFSAMSEQEKRGAISFFTSAGCGNCHNGPSLATMRFEAIGMNDLFECPEEVFEAGEESPANLGRGGFTGIPEENYSFKVPQLYNLKDSPFYGHGSSLRSIREVVEYKNKAIPQNSRVPRERISDKFIPLHLSAEEVDNITAFIENALYDPDLKRYEPQSLPSGFCFPFNDPVAIDELGCD